MISHKRIRDFLVPELDDIEDLAKPRKVIEMSRRNDIPAQHMEYAYHALKTGSSTYKNPFYRNVPVDELPKEAWVKVEFKPDDVFCISWLSKDYSEWLKFYEDPEKRPHFDKYKHHFQFAFNSEHPHSRLEPGLERTLPERLEQLKKLVEIAKKQNPDPNLSVRVNFVPILVYKDLTTDELFVNTSHVPTLFEEVKKMGINEVHISFLEPHAKVTRRTREAGIFLYDMNRAQKMWILEKYIFPYSRKFNIKLHACVANKENRDFIDEVNVSKETCFSYNRIKKIGKGTLRAKRMQGKDGINKRECSCQHTTDIGSYDPVCKHGCVYCYANSKNYTQEDFVFDQSHQDTIVPLTVEEFEKME